MMITLSMEDGMTTVTVSPKYQIVIPRKVRESMGIQPGEKIRVFQYGDRIEFIPVRRMRAMGGFLRLAGVFRRRPQRIVLRALDRGGGPARRAHDLHPRSVQEHSPAEGRERGPAGRRGNGAGACREP